MLTLSIESSAKPVSVAVTQEGKLLGQYFQNNGFSHSRTLLNMARSLLKNLDLKPTDIELVAVASGPGSFTGIRIGVSAAKGIAWGLDIPICGVSTLEAMAYQTQTPDVIICPVMDARRNQVYNALFQWQSGKLIRHCPDRAISTDDLATHLQTFDKPFLLVGDGINVCQWDDSPIPPIPELTRYQTAYGVALAAMNSTSVPATELEPFYLRPSQAERERACKR